MNTLTYKGYTARIEFDERDNIFVGRLLGIKDSITFHADNVAELRLAFEEAVEDYLETCQTIGKPPEKPASGKLSLRLQKIFLSTKDTKDTNNFCFFRAFRVFRGQFFSWTNIF